MAVLACGQFGHDTGSAAVGCEQSGALIHSRPALAPGHLVAAAGMVYAVELQFRDKRPPIPRISLVRPTAAGFESAGALVPERKP